MAFVEHENEIKTVILKRKAKAVRDRKKAKVAGILQTCSCCFDDEVMPTDIYECENGCIFCKNCIRRGTEVAFGDGKLEFVCLNSCSSFFSLRTLQVKTKVVHKKKYFLVLNLFFIIQGVSKLDIPTFWFFVFLEFFKHYYLTWKRL